MTTVHLTGNQNGARAKIMRALSESGMLPTLELVDATGLTAKQIHDNCSAARKESLLTTERDDVTGLAAYKLTAEGRQWVISNLRPRTEDEIANFSIAEMMPDLDITADETEKTATREIPAEIPRGFNVGMCHIVVPDSGDSDGLHFSSLQESIDYAIGNNSGATIYRLVEAGRVELRPVFVPAEK